MRTGDFRLNAIRLANVDSITLGTFDAGGRIFRLGIDETCERAVRGLTLFVAPETLENP